MGAVKAYKRYIERGVINNSDVESQLLKRAVGNVQDLEINPDYYFSNDKKDYWSFYEIENAEFV